LKSKVISLLGICNKAGKIVFGYDRVEKEIQSNTLRLIFIAKDFSKKSAEKATRLAKLKQIPVINTDLTIDELYYLLSYKSGIFGIKDKGFAEKLQQLLQEEDAI
jgi:ribosomal protein L7Ae-like RNA K-turn-binding protein